MATTFRRKPHRAIAFPCTLPKGFRRRLRLGYLGVDGPKAALAAATRQAFPVIAYTGSNGGGKTFAAVYDLLPVLAGQRWQCRNVGHRHTHAPGCGFRPDNLSGCTCELADVVATVGEWDPENPDSADLTGRLSDYRGFIPGTVEGWRLVWSTTPLFDAETGGLHRYYRPLRSLNDLLRCEHGEVLADEVQGIADARDHMSLPAGIRKMIFELRRRDVRFRWTTVDYSAADARIRQITQAVVYCRGFDAIASDLGLWGPKTRFRWATFDAQEFDAFTAGKRQDTTPLGVQHFYRPGHVAEDTYDTLAPVLALTLASDSGVCMACGGSKRRDPCGCPTDPASLPPGVVVEVDDKGRRRRRVLTDEEQYGDELGAVVA